MSRSPTEAHLLAAISAHGYGHLAQVAPVLDAIAAQHRSLHLTVRTVLPETIVRRRLAVSFDLVDEACDVGMAMVSAMEVDVQRSAAAYRELHRNWERRVDAEAQRIAQLAPDLVLADVPYLTLAGAARAGVPSVALCSLNWADIYWHYLNREPEAEAVHRQMLDAYNSAQCFLQPAPSMPMDTVHRTRPIGPIAGRGRLRRAELCAQLGISEQTRLVLVSPGGVTLRLPVEDWPPVPGLVWLVPESWEVRRPGFIALETLPLPYLDLLRSCDAFICKPGYGSFAEAACSGARVLFVSRDDWPEEPYLVRWLLARGGAVSISREQLWRGEFLPSLETLLAIPAPAALEPGGIDEAAGHLMALLAGAS